MARIRTVDFLPEIFQTSTNRQFLSATLDQLVQEPNLTKVQGFVGRRVGPGVNPDDEYIKEPTATRTNYQLEPGVVLKKYDTSEINDIITYPGITDAISLAGGPTNNADRLYTSDYYSWDPFIDFDKFSNFSQYYWLPSGPDAVNVFAGDLALTNTFDVTRENGVYTFSGVAGNNPVLRLARGGSYKFNVAQNAKETVNYRVSTDGLSSFVIDYKNNPELTLVRGNTYVFTLVQSKYAFYIKTQNTLGTTNQYTNGVTNNGAIIGKITFTVPQDAPDTLYYTNDLYRNLSGKINVVNSTSGTGPGFWIQVDPGVDGKLTATPNISGRDVLGVENNGEDLGTVTFNVPTRTAQDFYYSLNKISNVDLITNLNFNQINNVPVDLFMEEHNGIDGTISDLDGKTLVFQETSAGWEYTVIGTGFGDGFDASTPVPEDLRYGVWQINYQTLDGVQYMTLSNILSVSRFDQFTILGGTVYSKTQWFKNSEDVFEEIPVLSAVKSTLYYQDATDPEIFGRIELVDVTDASTLDVNEIIGKANYVSPNGVTFTNGLKVTFVGNVIPSSYAGNSYYVEGVGTAIKLLHVSDFITPETYTQSATIPYDSTAFDVGNYDASLNQPLIPDYLTINRASLDLNAWTRSNRWFHVDVINASAEYNNAIAELDNNFRAKRPIIEFRAGTRLFDFGTQGKQPVNIIDFESTDALSNINGSVGYSTDGYTFVDGSRVIFAADLDPSVRNKIYTVQYITPDTAAPLISQPVINLVPAEDAQVLVDQTVVCLSGNTQQGLSYYYDGVEWLAAQQKTQINQAPLFNVYDTLGVSLDSRSKYPSTNFTGSKLFSYAVGSGPDDTILGFPLTYLSLTNVGDIVFENNLYKDTFTYTKDSVSSTEQISLGYVREYSTRTDFVKEIGWQTAATKSISRQQFSFVYDGSPLVLDIPVDTTSTLPALQIYVSGIFIDPNDYTYTVTGDTTSIVINTIDEFGGIGSTIEVDAISSKTSKYGFYQVPVNLENNPFNGNSKTFTLGTIRAHYESIAENLKALTGKINGANNSRDLGNIIPYGENILQQSAPMTLAGYFMRSHEYNVFSALEYNSREYEKFKAQLLDTATRYDYTNYSIPDMLTAVINEINTGKTETSPFYWSDMLPASSLYSQTTTTITPISTNVFDLSTTYDFTSSNFKSVLVYVNDRILTIDKDYVVATDGPRLTITSTLVTGDVVVIREYGTTYGNFVPNTPTKMGLWPAWRPKIYIDTNYITPQTIIQGHDGSLTVAFGDFRDQLLLEFETRIFDNLKIKSAIPLPITEVMPGQFRTTDYTLAEVNQILAVDFLSWIGWNKLNYQNQDFIANNQFTWNYSASGNKLTGPNEAALPVAAWRGLYQYFYDTSSPNTTPWEMLGFSIEPAWWEDVYGPAPYTSDNLVLWDDLAAGRVADPAGEYYLTEYARPQLTSIIPTGTQGELLSPFASVVGYYDASQFQKSWVVGDQGPVEYSWRKSSSYPFAAMRLLALTRPAEFFSLFADRDLYKFDIDYNQYLYNGRYRLDANGIEVYGNGTSKASFINWIVDYNRQAGINSTVNLNRDLASLDVRLCYRIGAFTDKQYLKIYTEKSSPNSLNSSLLLPDESYNLLLYKNQPFDRINYSSVIMQVVDGGYAVYGYSITQPYFQTLISKTYGKKTSITAGGQSVTVPLEYTDQVVQVPYGYVFTNKTVVVDFLLSYGALLESRGLIFEDKENGYNLNWNQMAQEFLYWANQGWEPGAVINLNPAAFSISAYKPQSIIDSIVAQTPENNILDQNRTTLSARNLVIDRYDNLFKVSTLDEQTISYLDLKFTNYESIVVLDNISVFNDLIYNPMTGARQNRINVSAVVNADWNGQLDAQGFIYNNLSTVEQWQSNKKYAKGEIVIYKNNYYSAQTIVQPKIEFDYNDWVKSDYTKIQRGLLQNLSNFSNQLANSYNTNDASLETDQDLVSFGLIGFRPREYMTALNLDDISQVNLYKQFLKDKGTSRSIQLIGNAKTNKEVAEYNLYENWAILKGTYGANANKSFIELRLNAADLLADPATVQVVNSGQESQADQQILLSNLWRQSYKVPTTDIFPTTTTSVQDSALPSAGYVNLDDVDITVFSLDAQLSFEPGVLDTIGIGTTIWAAKSNQYDWNVYRCIGVPGVISSVDTNLNSSSQLTFTKKHNLVVGDIIVVRSVDTQVDGVYKILAVPTANTVIVNLSITKSILSNGVAVVLKTIRVAQASDVTNLPYANSLVAGTKVWVDNNGAGLWQVLEKQTPFTQSSTDLPQGTLIYKSEFGYSISQGYKNIIAAVGAPGYRGIHEEDNAIGAVYSYLRDSENQYAIISLLTLNAQGVLGYGRAIDIGKQSWVAVGAPNSVVPMGVKLAGSFDVGDYCQIKELGSTNWQAIGAPLYAVEGTLFYATGAGSGTGTAYIVTPDVGFAAAIYRADDSNEFETRQLLTPPQDGSTAFGSEKFGSAVSISLDERWMYIGAPGYSTEAGVNIGDRVYAYARQDFENQISSYTTTGSSAVFSYAGQIVVDGEEQIYVVYNNKVLAYPYDYSISGNNVILTFIPPEGQQIVIQRKTGQLLDSRTYYDVGPDSTSGTGTAAEFTITNTRGTYSATITATGTGYAVTDTLTFDGSSLASSYWAGSGPKYAGPYWPTTPTNDLTITVNSVDDAGSITGFSISGSGIVDNYIFSLTPYLYTVSDIYSFTVTVDGVLQRPYVDYTLGSDSFGATLIFNQDNIPAAGASIAVSSKTQFTYVDTLEGPAGSMFGSTISQTDTGRLVVVGAIADDSESVNNSGAVYAYDRGVIKYIIDDVTQDTFDLPAGYIAPVAVIVNGEYLENSDQFINGQFSVVGDTVVLDSSVELNVGDVVEIENNIFTLTQIVTANNPFDESQYGAAIDVCPTNCSLYIGAPLDGSTTIQAGSVERLVNQARLYGVISSTVEDAVITAGHNIRINNQLVTVPAAPNNTIDGLSAAINNSGIPNITSTVSNGILTISVINLDAATEFDKLSVLPGTVGTAYADLGFEMYAYVQTITSPNPTFSAKFGTSLSISTDSTTLIVGAPGGDAYEPVTFDNNTTYFDDKSTIYSSVVSQSGIVYSYDMLRSSTSAVTSPSKFVFGQQIYDNRLETLDQWGSSVSYVNGRLLIGSPGSDLGDSSVNYGRAAIFSNITNRPAWYPIRQQTPVADIELFNSVYMYDSLTSSKTHFFDFINPLQGKILGAARQNIDYIASDNPAKYNFGPINNNGNFWADDKVGQIWWDVSSVRFIDPSQDDLVYTSRRWAQLFPGSTVRINQWIESDVPPGQYAGPGVPVDIASYTVKSKLNLQGVFVTSYYFWVTNVDIINTSAGKTLSTTGISRYIENPKSSGIPYIAPIDASTIAIYNGLEFLNAADTIIHIDYDRERTDSNVHTEFELIAEENPNSFINTNLYRKLQDSFCGVNSAGAPVPDITLSPAERFGVEFRPRQSMFSDRFSALENYLTYANSILAQSPITESKTFILLNSSEPEPSASSGEWNKRLNNIQELSYQNLNAVSLGYKYLIVSDETNSGLWSIYEVSEESLTLDRYTKLIRVQNYDTRKYWSYIDWYAVGYNRTVVPGEEVADYVDLAGIESITPVGSSVKVTANAQDKWEIYQRTTTGWDRVGLENGTIKFNNELWDYQIGRFGFDVEVFDAQYFDAEPVIETRKIIQAINEELFIDDMAIYRNRALILMFNFILSEFKAPAWLTKTSLIDVNHKIRELLPFQTFRQDNQDFVLDYIKEVKPYHVQIREFNLTYNGQDDYTGNMTDFDVPAYYNRLLEIPKYVSPVLLPYTTSTATGTGKANDIADTPADAEIWTQWPWINWYNHYLLSIKDIDMIDGGSGYTVPPVVTATGDCISPAVLEAVINSAGEVVAINIIDPGEGYSTTAVITITEGNGTGARAYAIMGNQLVRSIKTVIKYDRCEYTSDIVDWEASTAYTTGTQVRYNNKVWEATVTNSSATFDPDDWIEVPAGDLNAANRTQGYYTPAVNNPGLELPLLIDGIDYPGVQVMGVTFNRDSGFDVGNFDINPFDNIAYGPEGRPGYDPAILDAIYESAYLDPFLGIRPTDVNVDGGAYVDTYSSFAPEELVPGAEFDTLDMRVYTRPGSDWAQNGHGFDTYSLSFEVESLPRTYSFETWYNYVPYLVTGVLTNQTTGTELIVNVNYTINWGAKTFTVTSGCNIGDVLVGVAYGVGGGNQLFRQQYAGNLIVNNKITVPVAYAQIQEVDVWVNGSPYTNVTYTSGVNNTTIVEFGSSFGASDLMTIYVLGPTTIDSTTVNYSWSAPVTQTIVADGSLLYSLDNSLAYTNPANMIVEVNGVRARTAGSVEYYADGSSAYLLPERLGFSESLIADNEVLVYINDIPQVLGVDYTVEPYTGDYRHVVFATTPSTGERILIAVTTNTQAKVTGGDSLYFNPTQGLVPIAGDIITVKTWNDTRQQDILTLVYVGPVETGIDVAEGYDSTDFDAATINNTAGSFDYTAGIVVIRNNFYLTRTITHPNRLWVTLNGDRLFYGEDFTLLNNELILASGVIGTTDELMITMFTDSIVPDAMAFRIFQDMRGVQATYRIIPDSTTILVQTLEAYDDIIYVEDASKLDEPNVVNNVWGVLTINGERIMYRERDIETNTVSSLLRGTAGTAVATHNIGNSVYAMGRGELATAAYQDYISSDTFTGDDSTVTFTTDIVVDNRPIVYVGGTVDVYVDDVLVDPEDYTVTQVEPVVIVFNTFIPSAGSVVLIRVTNTFGSEFDTTINATGSNARFVTLTDIGLIEQLSSTYTLDDFNPVTITFDTAPPDGRVVYIRNQRGAEDEFDYTFADGVETTFATNIDLSLPVRVFVGGTELTRTVDYNVTSLDPIVVVFTAAPANGSEVQIWVRNGVTWYQSDGINPSNGVALQDTNTDIARFFKGL